MSFLGFVVRQWGPFSRFRDHERIFIDLVSQALSSFRFVALGDKVLERPQPIYGRYHGQAWPAGDNTPEGKCKIEEHVDGDFLAIIIVQLWHIKEIDLPQRFLSEATKQSLENGYQAPTLYNKVVMPFLKRMCQLFGNDLDNLSTLGSCFAQLLDDYLRHYVGKDASKPTNWALQSLNCSCSDCAQISVFMCDPRVSVHRLKAAQRRRTHIESEFRDKSCTYTADRNGSPQTFVIQKTHKHYNEDHAAWLSRLATAQMTISKMDQQVLRMILGPDYKSLVDPDSVRKRLSLIQPVLGDSDTIGTSKRKLDVVDVRKWQSWGHVNVLFGYVSSSCLFIPLSSRSKDRCYFKWLPTRFKPFRTWVRDKDIHKAPNPNTTNQYNAHLVVIIDPIFSSSKQSDQPPLHTLEKSRIYQWHLSISTTMNCYHRLLMLASLIVLS